ncbi:hypothetical protein AMECASPLE_034947 [Ameca splendens]|uniref:Uncharacterized protein n=1 Tax=Ameca splendens TaxID=208324 RepID=A0ABV1AEA5_9TELE
MQMKLCLSCSPFLKKEIDVREDKGTFTHRVYKKSIKALTAVSFISSVFVCICLLPLQDVSSQPVFVRANQEELKGDWVSEADARFFCSQVIIMPTSSVLMLTFIVIPLAVLCLLLPSFCWRTHLKTTSLNLLNVLLAPPMVQAV